VTDDNAQLRKLITDLVEMLTACVPAARLLNTNAFLLVNRARAALAEPGQPVPFEVAPLMPCETCSHAGCPEEIRP